MATEVKEKSNEWEGKPFVYDEPEKFLFRLFQLDIPEDDADISDDVPLSGRLLSSTFDEDLLETFSTMIQSLREDRAAVMKELSGTDGYIALSYSWGQSKERWPLYLSTVSCKLGADCCVMKDHEPERNGYLQITRSARTFLLEMRRQKDRKFIWIDAICIDQSSERDRDNQIPQMGPLYENASMVYVWLGEATSIEEMALRMLPNLQKKLGACDVAKHNTLEVAFESAGLPEPQDDIWKAYASILTRDYWSRLWAFQEVVMAPTVKGAIEYDDFYKAANVQVWCGKVKTMWEQFDHFAGALAKNKLNTWLLTRREDVVLDHLHGLDAITEVRTGRGSQLTSGWGLDLSALLVSTRRREASKPIDMVLGMYALIDHASRKKLALRNNMSEQEIFIRFAKHYIRNEHKECLLNHGATTKKLPGLPSWCPNFASHENTVSIGTRWLGHVQEASWLKAQMPCAGFQKKGPWTLPRSKLYYAKYLANALTAKTGLHGVYDTNNPRQIALIPDSNAIRASGVHLDTIAEVTDCNPGADSTTFLTYEKIQQTSAWDQACFSLAQRTMASTPQLSTSKSKYDLYARTLTANRVARSLSNDVLPNSTWAEILNLNLEHTEPLEETIFDRGNDIDFAERYLSFRKFMRDTLDAGKTLPAKDNLDAATRSFSECLSMMSKGRRFFATKAGRIGLGSSDAEPGDSVVVFFYCPTPYLIRPMKGDPAQWQFVGEAYVNGFMYGEALEMFDAGKVQERTWILG